MRPNEKFDSKSNEGLVYSRVVQLPEINWALAETHAEQADEEGRKRFREDGLLDYRRPNVQWTAQGSCEGSADHQLVKLAKRRPATTINEHDGLGFGAVAFILGAPTIGISPMPHQKNADGLAHRVCSVEYLSRHFAARLAHVVVSTTVLRECVVFGDSAFLRGCAPIGDSLIDHGVLDFRPDGVLQSYHVVDGAYRLMDISVGGVTHLRWPRTDVWLNQRADMPSWSRQALQIGDDLFIAIIADAFDVGGADVQMEPAVVQWLERTTGDFVYDVKEYSAYLEARERLLSMPPDSGTHAEGAELRLTHFRIVPITSTLLWAGMKHDHDHARCAKMGSRAQLGLRSGRGVSEHVVFAWKIGRVMDLESSWDGLFKACVGIESIESEQFAANMGA